MIESRMYDLVIPMGQSCSCTQALRVSRLQWLSLPFDWVGGSTWVEEIRIMEEGFSDWMNPSSFLHIGDRRHPQGRIYRNVETELIYSHEVPIGSSWSELQDIISEKYERRVRRLWTLLHKSKSVLAVRMSVPGGAIESDYELIECQQRFAGMCRHATVELLYLVYRAGCHKVRERKVGEHILVAELDFGEKGVLHPNPLVPDIDSLEKYLTRYSCKDYRNNRQRRSSNATKDYHLLFGITDKLPRPPNKVWDYGPKAFELTPLPFTVTFKENNRFRQELDEAVRNVLDEAIYVDGKARVEFENRFASFIGANQVIALSSMHEAMRFIARLMRLDGKTLLGRVIRFRNCSRDEVVREVAAEREDNGFAIADLSELVVGGICDGIIDVGKSVAIFSFDEQSNMSVFGNLVCVAFPDGLLDSRVECACADELQCALAKVKLEHVLEDNKRRNRIARRYMMEIHNPKFVMPRNREVVVWNRFPVSVQVESIRLARLAKLGVKRRGCELDLPTSPGLSNGQIGKIIATLNGVE